MHCSRQRTRPAQLLILIDGPPAAATEPSTLASLTEECVLAASTSREPEVLLCAAAALSRLAATRDGTRSPPPGPPGPPLRLPIGHPYSRRCTRSP